MVLGNAGMFWHLLLASTQGRRCELFLLTLSLWLEARGPLGELGMCPRSWENT